MAYTPYYAPYYRPTNYYNQSIPQEVPQNAPPFNQQFQQPQPITAQQPIQQMQMTQSIPMAINDMNWVLNETEATSYPVAPNNSVTLWDKNKDTVYIKSVNMQGIPSMRILDYVERTPENTSKTPEKHDCKCGKDFVSVDRFNALQSDLEALRNELEELKAKPKAKTAKIDKEE